jgi:nucleoside-diphosphate-sugar epimerase
MIDLVIGGRGLIGSAVVAALIGQRREVYYTTRSRHQAHVRPRAIYLDLSEPNAKLPQPGESSSLLNVFLIAGLPGVIACERDPNAWRVNADSPRMLAQQARAGGASVVYLSTGAVEIAPHAAYAMQKAAVENVVLALGGAVVRPRGKIDQDSAPAFAEFIVGASGRPGVHWWEE